ncbi:AMP-binding protein, partial [Sporichthya sp.]|uniref:AMP-binding protein n=1 Tax=Sporichthya sp. TaxID=65475 RepID=UPI0017F91B40
MGSAPDRSGAGPPANLAGLLSAAAARDPEGLALVAGGHGLSWSELDATVTAVAAGLRARDLRFGDRVAMSLPNSVGFVQLYLGALRAGLVVAPLDPSTPTADTDAALADTGARLHVTHEAAVADLIGAGTGTGTAPEPGPVPGGESLAALLQTAGTGGRPKRAMLSHRALLANLDQMAALEPAPVVAADVVLLALPMFHVFGLNAVFGQALHAGARMVLAPDGQLDAAASLLDLVASSGVTSVAGTPELYAAWTAHPRAREALAGVRVLVSGSA